MLSNVLNEQLKMKYDDRVGFVLLLHVFRLKYVQGRIASEFVAIGAQCKGERHEQTISRQREALNELRARIRTLEQLRPANPAYEKVLQQVVLLKRELAELRARQALPTDIPYLMTTPGSNSLHQQSQKPSATASRQSPTGSAHSDDFANAQKILEERTAHAETTNSLQTFDELVRSEHLSFSHSFSFFSITHLHEN